MELNYSDVEKSLNAYFSELYAHYNNMLDQKILMQYFGELSQGTSYALTNKIEKLLESEGDAKGIVKRVFSIFVESLQNIRVHSPKDTDGNQFAFFIIAQSKTQYACLIGNLIPDSSKDFLIKRIEEINSLNKEDLKNLYLNTMTNGVISEKGGAGLGIITVAMKSGNKISYDFRSVENGFSIYTIKFVTNRTR
jgi:Family of unknown function (DUF6272)